LAAITMSCNKRGALAELCGTKVDPINKAWPQMSQARWFIAAPALWNKYTLAPCPKSELEVHF
jgi:hypothetical protein